MEAYSLILTALSTVAGVVGAYYAFRAVRPHKRAQATKAMSPRTSTPCAPRAETFDVFISHGKSDRACAQRIASELERREVKVFLDEWSIKPGDVSSVRRGEGIERAANGLLLFSQAALAESAVTDDYAALLSEVHGGDKRFIPVVIEPISLPIFARIRHPVDLSHDSQLSFSQKMATLADVVKNRGAASSIAEE